MRIIGGTLKGRHLSTTKGDVVRPTTDKVREALFSILSPCLTGGTVLDLFAGTGSLGLEAISRGMDRAVFIENNPLALAVLKNNVVACKAEGQSEIIRMPVNQGLRILRSRNYTFVLIFLDPPYRHRLVEKTLVEIDKAGILASKGTIVAEHAPQELIASTYGALILDDQRRYGQTLISFFTKRL